MTTAIFIKENIQLRLIYSFRGLVHYHYAEKHDIMQTDMLVEKELRVLHLDPQATGRELCTTLGIA